MSRHPQEQLYIGDIAQRLNISQRTIRYYEELGLIRPTRTAGGFRTYDSHECERLKAIMLLKELGMSLDEIVEITHIRHEGSPAKATPKLRSHLVAMLGNLSETIERYRRGMDEIQAVLDRLKVCSSCGQNISEQSCTRCLTRQPTTASPLMKALL